MTESEIQGAIPNEGSVLFAMVHNYRRLHTRMQNDKLSLHLYELKPDEEKAS